MKHVYRLSLGFILATLFLAICAAPLRAQIQDSLEIIETPGGEPYLCCYDIGVTNLHDTTISISEFRLRIISGRARFITGQTDTPPFWTSFQDSVQVRWQSNSAADDIQSGETVTGFHICPRDTGIVKMIWETRTVDSVISSDTLVFACRAGNCDEPFFYPVPSNLSCVFDIDLAAGNLTGRLVNGFSVKPVTPGVTFNTTATVQNPTGWMRTKIKADTITWFSQGSGLNYGEFIQGLRLHLNAPRDSAIRIAWWTSNFDDIICRDTVTIRCGLSARDSIRFSLLNDSCCQSVRLANTHQPGSPIDTFIIRLSTPGVRILSGLPLPNGWTSVITPNGDSLTLTRGAGGLASGDTALFGAICFDNRNATSDTIRYSWQLRGGGIAIDTGSIRLICLRPLTRCDSVSIRVDSTFPASQRCVYLRLTNLNSRAAEITRFVARFSNPGTARRVRSANPAPGWVVESFSIDSAVFINVGQLPNTTTGEFEVCLSNNDTGMRDPLTLRWTTANGLGLICAGALTTNAVISSDCDSIDVVEIPSSDTSLCCLQVKFLNRNGKNRMLDRLQLEVGLPVIFASSTGAAGWNVDVAAFPSFDIAFSGSTLQPDSTSPTFIVCVDLSQAPKVRPFTVPITWRTLQGEAIVCVDTVRVVCTGQAAVACDSTSLIGSRVVDSLCEYAFRVDNRHTPAGVVDGVKFSIVGGSGVVASASTSGSAIGFTAINTGRTTAVFTGDTIATGSVVDTFMVRLDSVTTGSVDVELCTQLGDRVLCCTAMTLTCSTSGVEIVEQSRLRLNAPRPNPAGDRASLSYSISRSGHVSISVIGQSGAVLVVIDKGVQGAGEYQMDLDLSGLAAGVYYVRMNVEGRGVMVPLVVVR